MEEVILPSLPMIPCGSVATANTVIAKQPMANVTKPRCDDGCGARPGRVDEAEFWIDCFVPSRRSVGSGSVLLIPRERRYGGHSGTHTSANSRPEQSQQSRVSIRSVRRVGIHFFLVGSLHYSRQSDRVMISAHKGLLPHALDLRSLVTERCLLAGR
jgi:hypothetical protein